jgi:hypothetical protein
MGHLAPGSQLWQVSNIQLHQIVDWRPGDQNDVRTYSNRARTIHAVVSTSLLMNQRDSHQSTV